MPGIHEEIHTGRYNVLLAKGVTAWVVARGVISKTLQAIQDGRAFLPHLLNLDEKLAFRLHCENCRHLMLIDIEIMGRALKSVVDRSHEVAVCPKCRQVRMYGLFGNSTDHNPKDKPILAHLRKETVFLQLLRCKDCRAKLPLFALWITTAAEDERKSDMPTWIWDGLHCPQGHRIEAPQG